MGSFRIDIEVCRPGSKPTWVKIPRVSVDTGAEISRSPVDEAVLARAGDLKLVGARTLEGFNAPGDPQRRRPVASGPIPAA